MLRVRTSKCTFDEHVRDDDERIGNAPGVQWCGKTFTPRWGARRKSFADSSAVAAEFVTQALADGRLTVTDLRNGILNARVGMARCGG